MNKSKCTLGLIIFFFLQCSSEQKISSPQESEFYKLWNHSHTPPVESISPPKSNPEPTTKKKK